MAFTSEAIGATPAQHIVVQAPELVIVDGRTLRVTLPNSAFSTDVLYYVRIKKDAAAGWSTSAKQFAVGSPPLYCQGTTSGNFGSLNLSRNDSLHGSWVAINTALGVQHNLGTMSPAVTPCAGNGGITAPSTPNPDLYGINCLDTEPGLVQQATEGFIKGNGGSVKGLLDTAGNAARNTRAGCNGGADPPVQMGTGANRRDYLLNNDVLTCFITGAASVGDVSAKVGAPTNVISEDIFNSPRFFYLPVLSNDPSNGRSGTWPIITFRAAFLTDEDVAATSIKGSNSASPGNGNSPGNGITIEQNDIKQMKVIFFNAGALPRRTGGGVTTYFGVGPRIIRLID